MSGLADTILFLANPGYFMLAKEFKVSVDDVASAFSSSYAGNAVFLYVALPARLTRTCAVPDAIYFCYRILHIPISVKFGHRFTYLLSAFLVNPRISASVVR